MLLFSLGFLVALGLALVWRHFASFDAQRVEDYADQEPRIRLEEALGGALDVQGLVYGPTGRVANRFWGPAQGVFKADERSLSEDFSYVGGMRALRRWDFSEVDAEGRFTARAEDLIGEAQGRIKGNVIQLRYTIVMPKEAGGWALRAHDWLYTQPDGTLINRSSLKKYGIKVAELVAVMRPLDAKA